MLWGLRGFAITLLLHSFSSSYAQTRVLEFCQSELKAATDAIEQLKVETPWTETTLVKTAALVSQLESLQNWTKAEPELSTVDCETKVHQAKRSLFFSKTIGTQLKNLTTATPEQEHLKLRLLKIFIAYGLNATPEQSTLIQNLFRTLDDKITLLQTQVWGINPFKGSTLPSIPAPILRHGDLQPDFGWLSELLRRVPSDASRAWLYKTWSNRSSAQLTTNAVLVLQAHQSLATKAGFPNWQERQSALTDLGVSADDLEDTLTQIRKRFDKDKALRLVIQQSGKFAKSEGITPTFGVHDFERTIDLQQQAAFGKNSPALSTFFKTDEFVSRLLGVWGEWLGFKLTPADVKLSKYPLPPTATAFLVNDSKTDEKLGQIAMDLHSQSTTQTAAQVFLYQQEALVVASLGSVVLQDQWDDLIGSLAEALIHQLSPGLSSPYRIKMLAGALREWSFEPEVLSKVIPLSTDQIKRLGAARDRRLAARAVHLLFAALADQRITTQPQAHQDPLKIISLQDTLFKALSGLGLPPASKQIFNRSEFWREDTSGLLWTPLWIEMGSFDLVTRFKPDRAWNPMIGQRFRNELIKPINLRPLSESIHGFLGRPLNPDYWMTRSLLKDREAL